MLTDVGKIASVQVRDAKSCKKNGSVYAFDMKFTPSGDAEMRFLDVSWDVHILEEVRSECS